jgi:hypothetical protein
LPAKKFRLNLPHTWTIQWAQWRKSDERSGRSKCYPGSAPSLFTRPEPVRLLALWNVKVSDDGQADAEPGINFERRYIPMRWA